MKPLSCEEINNLGLSLHVENQEHKHWGSETAMYELESIPSNKIELKHDSYTAVSLFVALT